MVTLESDRLIMRNYRESDLADYHKLMSDKDNMYYLIGLTTNSVEESQNSMNYAIDYNAKEKGFLFCIALKCSDRLIGGIGCEVPFITPVGKIVDPMGWFLMPEYKNKSRRVIEKAGFRKEAEKIKAVWLDGQMRDRLEFAINRDEYMQI